MSTVPSKVVIEHDGSESRSGVPALLAREAGAEVLSVRLEDGDYKLGDGILAERKAIADFLGCMNDGSLAQQLLRLAEAAEFPILIIEGDLQAQLGPGPGFTPETRRSMIAFLVGHWGIWTVQTKNQADTAAWLWTIARQAQRGVAQPPMHKNKANLVAARQYACIT